MALVSEECLNEWRMRNSWVYINFAYLFSNKIWKLRIPGGFSACPYFWFAMFSMLVFKPVLEPILLALGWVIKMILKAGGAPFVWWDKMMGEKLADAMGLKQIRGVGIAATIILVCLLAAAVIFLGGIYCFYRNLAAIGPQWTALFWYVVVNFGCMIPTTIYISKNRHNDDRCKVEWYNLVCFIITTTVLSLLYPAMVSTGLHNIGTALLSICWFLGEMLKAIGHALAVAGIFLGHYGWIALKFIGKWLFTFVVALVPVLLVCAAIGAFGLLLMKLFGNVQEAKVQEVNKVRKVTVDDWRDLLYYVFSDNYWIQALSNERILGYKAMKYYYHEIYSKNYAKNRYGVVISSTLKKIIGGIIDEIKIKDKLLNIPYHTFELLKSSVYKTFFINWKEDRTPWFLLLSEAQAQNIEGLIDEICAAKTDFTNLLFSGEKLNELFKKKFKAEFEKNIEEVDKELGQLLEQKEAEDKRRAAAKKRHDEMCKMLSTPIARFFTLIFSGIKYVFLFLFVTLIWKIIFIKIICFTARQIKIFGVYMWVVIKHLKHGACPYLQFIDPPVEKAQTVEKK